ncbi:MAG TPA: hypothetical protein VM536_18940 [Chloroflexia bacterium]|nr:hypothetical protein [Chloroflexia bacterium]
MTFSPAVLVFLGLATGYALLFHLWRGRNIQQLILFWLVSILGFGLGSFLASLAQLHVALLGGVPVVEASLAALLLLVVTERLVA